MADSIKQCLPSPLDYDMTTDELYNFFRNFVQSEILYIDGYKIVFYGGLDIRTMYSEAFYHMSTKKNGSGIRKFEERRFYINHIVPMIRHVKECESCTNYLCPKIKIWTVPYDNKTKRTKLLYVGDSYNYLIILETDLKNKNQLNVVTSYLGNEPWFLKKILKEYNKYKS